MSVCKKISHSLLRDCGNPYIEVIVLKKKLLFLGSYVLVAMLATVVTLTMVYFTPGMKVTKLEQLEQLIEEKFVGEADMTALADAAAIAMLEATDDRWSYYVPASEYESYQEQKENAYVGIGITIQAVEGGFAIIQVNPEGPAAEAGLELGDIIIAVAEQDVREATSETVRNLVRGEEGTFVTMTVLRQGDHRSVSVERRKVKTAVASHEMLENNIGRVTILNFDGRCAEETIAAIETLLENGAEKLIFDVRYNPGGFADEMVQVLDYLLPEGDLFRTVSYDGVEHVDTSDAACLELPMAVLVNSGSYSAAEFFAAALRDYDAAVIVGEQTSGKGFYQNSFQLVDGSAVSLSVGKYFTPAGNSLEGVGITPDRVVALSEEADNDLYYGLLAHEEDTQLHEAIKLLK